VSHVQLVEIADQDEPNR